MENVYVILSGVLAAGAFVWFLLFLFRLSSQKKKLENQMPVPSDAKRKEIKPIWAFSIMVAAVPAAGIFCAITENDISMFYWSLAAVPFFVVMLPIGFFLSRLIPALIIATVATIVVSIARLFSRKK